MKFPKYVKFKKTIKDGNTYPLIKGILYDVLRYEEVYGKWYVEIADEFGEILLLLSDDERMELIYE